MADAASAATASGGDSDQKTNGALQAEQKERGDSDGATAGSNVTKDRSSSTASDKRRRSTGNAAKRRLTKGSSTASVNSNGEGYGDYDDDDFDLEEPFSDSDDEGAVKAPSTRKLNLPIPRGRIRTLSGTVPAVGYSPKWGGPTMCVSCLQFFDLPSMVEQFTGHLLSEHHIVVTEIELIVDLKRYIEYWRQRFAKDGIEQIFPKVIPKEGDAYFGKSDHVHFMSEQLPEDYSLRQRLAMRRLEEALACQQREREESTFSQQCLFCRYTARGNRSKIIHHLYMIHHLNLGSPDNLVFVTEYVEHLREKLNRNECIYCEKTFADRTALMEHMRKRQHREVNPKNNYYDKFYIINYLELGKKWLDVLAEDFEDTMPTFVDSDEEEEEESWHEWQEDNLDEDQTRIVCLFCDESFDNAGPMIEHIKAGHDLDLIEKMEEEKMDVYARIKLINYIRKQTYNAICFLCGRDDLGSWQALRKHQADNGHLSKGLPARTLWDTD
uniref:C2H2-type domain-containing protein n=1 Tax=Plectus sambesii TaxID=2011161 RepID=A0A914VV17_9BILA